MNGLHLSFGVGTSGRPSDPGRQSELTPVPYNGVSLPRPSFLPAAVWLPELPSPVVVHPQQESPGLSKRWLPLLISDHAFLFFVYWV